DLLFEHCAVPPPSPVGVHTIPVARRKRSAAARLVTTPPCSPERRAALHLPNASLRTRARWAVRWRAARRNVATQRTALAVLRARPPRFLRVARAAATTTAVPTPLPPPPAPAFQLPSALSRTRECPPPPSRSRPAPRR